MDDASSGNDPKPRFDIGNIDFPRQGTHQYSIVQKFEAAIAWSVIGSTSETAKVIKVPERTLRGWVKEEWWPQALAEARRVKSEELDARLSGIIDKSMKKMNDILDSDNPGTLNQVAVAMAIAYDKRALMRGDPTSRTERIDPVKRLETLRAEFSRLPTDDVQDAVLAPDELHLPKQR